MSDVPETPPPSPEVDPNELPITDPPDEDGEDDEETDDDEA